MTIFFISDTHFGHDNILKFKDDKGVPIRHFTSTKEMDDTMIENWNKTIKLSDHVYHLGDFTMKRRIIPVARLLNGHKRLIRGNHDIFHTKEYIEAGFKEVYGSRYLDNILFTHIPIHPACMGRFMGNAHGHIHHRSSPKGPYLNLSAEVINYTPVSLEEVKSRLELLCK